MCVCVCVCVCVFTQNSHIRKFSAVFLYGFSHTAIAPAPVTGLRRTWSAACAGGCKNNVCPYCFIVVLCFKRRTVLRALTKLTEKQAMAMDFSALVVQKIHACCPKNSRILQKCLIFNYLQNQRFSCPFCRVLRNSSGFTPNFWMNEA